MKTVNLADEEKKNQYKYEAGQKSKAARNETKNKTQKTEKNATFLSFVW